MTHLNNWDIFSAQVLKTAISPEQVIDGEKALAFFRKHFGDLFLHEAVKNHHPFYGLFVYNPSYQLEWIYGWYLCIQQFEKNQKFSSIVRDLKNPATFWERIQVLEIAHAFSDQGFKITFDREFDISGFRPRPDLHLTSILGEEVVVEVKQVTDGLPAKQVDEYWNWITEITWKHLKRFGLVGHIYRKAEDKEMGGIEAEFVRAGKQLDEGAELVTIFIPGLVDVAASNEPIGSDALQDWCRQKGFEENTLIGPSKDIDENQRVCFSILEKAKRQLPEDRMGVVFIGNVGISSMGRGDGASEKLIDKIEELFAEIPHVGLVAVASLFVPNEPVGTKRYRDHFIINREYMAFHRLNTLIVKNTKCKNPVSEATSGRLIHALGAF